MTLYLNSGGVTTKARLVTSGGQSVPRILGVTPPPPAQNGATTYAAETLGAGGWVTGIAISPDGNTRHVRCDTYGGWRWDAAAGKWKATTTADSLSAPFNALDGAKGVFAIAAANDRAYMATADAIFTSTDRGVTWATSLASGPKTSPNISGVKRYSNHMAIDPSDSLTCLYGTVNQGVYYTRDGGSTWTQVPSSAVPIGVDGLATPGNSTFGVLCVAIDAAGNWYASPYGSGLYQSTNQGTSWAKISTDTDFVAALGIDIDTNNGDMMVCGTTSATTGGVSATNCKVLRYRSGTWTNITPTGTARAWKAPAFDPTSPGRVMVQADGGYTNLSTDYGTNWTNQIRSFVSPNPDVAWLAASNGNGSQTFFTTIGGLQWDPIVSGRVWMSQGIGVWYADPSGGNIVWNAQSRGIEQVVVNDVTCPPGGRPIVTCWDRPIFVVGETTGSGPYPYQYHPDDGILSSGWHADYSASDPTWIAASVWDRSGFAAPAPGYSTDGGVTWTTFATIPALSGSQYFAGSIHVGTPGHIIWVSSGSKGASYTTDSGATWTAVAISGVTVTSLNTQSYYFYRHPVASEKTAGSADTFYVHAPNVGFYKSTDVGATWTKQCDNTPFAGYDWSQMTYLKTVPGHPGHLFDCIGWQGAGGGVEATGRPFKRTTDGGVTWTTVGTIDTVRGFDFGVGAAGSTYPAIYAVGYVSGIKGAYRSDDNAATWTLLSTQPNDTTDFIRNVGASQETYGKHWITTAGSGLIVGTLT